MLKFSLKHHDALTRAETNVLKCYGQNIIPQVRRELDDDLLRLAELKRFVLQAIFQPGLPLTNLEVPEEMQDGPENNES